MVLVVFLIAFLGEVLAAPRFIPFMYATPDPVYNAAYTTTQYTASLCQGSEYNGLTAQLSVDLPLTAWSWSSQQIVYVSVADQHGTIVKNNTQDTGSPIQDIEFVYLTTMGDLTITCATANAPSVLFTFSIEFISPTSPLTSMDRKQRRKNSLEIAPSDFAPPPVFVPSGTVVQLDQIIAGSSTFQIATDVYNAGILIDFDYCPTAQSYNVQINVVATDELSAFATYICVNPTEMPCSAGSAQRSNSDPSGVALNTVLLSTNTAEYASMQAAIYGWGRFGGVNSAVFSVSVRAT